MLKSTLLRCLIAALSMIAAVPAMAAAKAGLHVDVYNPGDKALFAVSSEIVSGPTEVMLIDAQMRRTDAEMLVAMIKATGKRLTAVYVSQGDPDFYFGLETIRAAFPGVRIVAKPQTIAAINATKAGKLAYWGPKLGADAPSAVIVPEVLAGDTLTVDGETLKVVGLDGPTPDRTFVWLPAERVVLGGTVIVANEHVFIADTQTPQSRADWRTTLAQVETLKPTTVIPGHYHLDHDRDSPRSSASVRFTREYLDAFEMEDARTASSGKLIAAMKQRYPALAGEPVLEISAKVIEGEMKWRNSRREASGSGSPCARSGRAPPVNAGCGDAALQRPETGRL